MVWNKRLGQYDIRTKLLDHLDSLLALKKRERPFPISAEIHMSNHCNHRCHFCEATDFFKTDRTLLETIEAKKVVYELKNLGVQGIVWSGGGEPLLHPDFFEILDLSHSLGIANGLITNFSLVPTERIGPLVQQLSWLRVSFNAGNRKNYQEVHGLDHFDRVSKNIKMLIKANQKDENNLPISLSMVYDKKNLHSTLDLVKHAAALRVNSLHIRPDQFIEDVEWLTSDDVKQKLEDAKRLPQKMQSSLQVSTSEYMEQQYIEHYPPSCYAHFFTLSITADGAVNFCKSRFDTPETNCGDIHSMSLHDIWNTPHVKALEKQIQPHTCAGFCRQMHVNVHVHDLLSIPEELDTRFI